MDSVYDEEKNDVESYSKVELQENDSEWFNS